MARLAGTFASDPAAPANLASSVQVVNQDKGERHEAAAGARRRHRRDDGRQQAAPQAGPGRVADHRRRPGRQAPLPAGLPVHPVRHLHARARSRRSRHGSSPTASSSCSARSTGSTPTPATVLLADGRRLAYDYLVIATGVTPRPDQTPGMLGDAVADVASSTSTPSTARPRWPRRCATFDGGRLVVHITEMPIKCPVAPLEFTFLAEAFFREPRHARPGRDHLRDAAARGVHQADLLEAARLHARRAEDRARDRLHGRAHRQRRQDARLLRRARDPVRPAGHRPAEHGRRLRRALRPGRRAQLRAGRQAHAAVQGARQHLRARRRERHPDLQGRIGGALRGRDLHRQLPPARSPASR